MAMNAAKIRTIGVVGAGQMGAGIAQVAASVGVRVYLLDTTLSGAQQGKEKIAALVGKQVEKGKLDAASQEALLSLILPTSEPGDFSNVDVAIEAAVESLEIKLGLFRQLDAILPPEALLASNTSSISITKLAAATSRPDRTIGMHFMNPVPLMKLIEIVRGVQTSLTTYETIRDLALRFGKTVITSKDQPGFLVNRILVPFLNEACFALQEGLGTMEDIDQGARLGLNHPMGPFELADLIGLDTLLAIAEVLHREMGDDKYRPATLLRNLVAAQWLGRKTNRGFYVYDDKGQRIGRAFEP